MSEILCPECGHKYVYHASRGAGYLSSCLIQGCDCELKRDDIADVANELTAEHEEHARLLSNLLAVIHCDGGHYQEERGTFAACSDAEARILQERAERDALKAAMWDVRDALERGESYYIIGNIIRAALEKVGKK